MGWVFDFESDRDALIKRLCGGFREGYTHLEHRVVGNHVWHLLRVEETGRVRISLSLIAKERNGGWGYNCMGENEGFYHYDCPLSLLNKASPVVDGHIREWRVKVRQHHASASASASTFSAGEVVKYNNVKFRIGSCAGPRRGYNVVALSNGLHYRLTAKQLKAASLCQ